MSYRTLVNQKIVDSIKLINGLVSTFDNTYTYKTNIHENCYRGLKYIDEINDYPSIYVSTTVEDRFYNTAQVTESEIETVMRCYVHGDDTTLLTNNLVQDIEHVIYNIVFDNQLQVQDVTIKRIITDSGLLKPYGMVEIFLHTRLEIYN